MCTMKRSCKTNLTNSAIFQMVGVAMDKTGNCWASAYNARFGPALVYFAKCKGAGVSATGYQNTSPGGLDIDKAGNLVAIDTSANNIGALWVYSGCKPRLRARRWPLRAARRNLLGSPQRKLDSLRDGELCGRRDRCVQIQPDRSDVPVQLPANGLTPSDSGEGSRV